MSNQNPWGLIRFGNTENGLALMRESYTRNPNASHIMQLGIAYLWVKDYPAAWEHFQNAIRTYRHTMSVFHGMAGVTKWCTDEPGEAVIEWRKGLRAQYADGAGGIQLPLLLFVTSILRPTVFPRKDAEQILLDRVKDPRAKNWPGPVAKLVLGLGDENSLPGLCRGVHELDTRGRKWSARFYRAVTEFGNGNLGPSEFTESMRTMANTSQPEWAEEKYFLALIWKEEFFIARNEAQPKLRNR